MSNPFERLHGELENTMKSLYWIYMKVGDTVGIDGLYKILINRIIDGLAEVFENIDFRDIEFEISNIIEKIFREFADKDYIKDKFPKLYKQVIW